MNKPSNNITNKADYNEDVVLFLRQNYPTKGSIICSQLLGSPFTPKNIRLFCFRNGIKFDRGYNGENFQLSDFKNPSSKEMAYFLGLAWGDGSLRSNLSQLTIEVVREDGDLFLKMIQCLGHFSVNYRSRSHKPIISITLNNSKICSFLETLGFREKSLISPCKVLEIIPSNLQRFFWLGFFDADGCIYLGGSMKQLSFSGGYDQDWSSLCSFLDGLGCKWVKQKNITNSGRSSFIRICSKFDILTIKKTFYSSYSEDNIGLPRKKEKFDAIPEESGRKIGASGFRGVKKDGKLFLFNFIQKGVIFSIRGFLTASDAAREYDKHAVSVLGIRAITNFPIKNYINLISEPLE